MKHIYLLLMLLGLSITSYSQTRRIKLHQVQKDTITGSILISGQDTSMTYSRDFYISYGTDTVLILYGDTVGKSSLSSVLTDNKTILGSGVNGDVLRVDTSSVIATKGDLTGYVDLTNAQTISGAKTFTSLSWGTSAGAFMYAGGTSHRFAYSDSNTNYLYSGGAFGFRINNQADNVTLFTIEDGGNVGIGTGSPQSKLQVNGSITNGVASNEESDATIDFSLSNIAYSNTSSNTITLSNIKSGGAYTLILTNTGTSDTVTFNSSNFPTFKYMGTVARTNGKQHIYSFIVVGTTVYVTMGTEN